MGFLTGKPATQTSSGQSTSSSTSSSDSRNWNTNKDLINQNFTGQAQNGAGANNALAALLGIGGDPTAQQGAFDNWKNNTGYQFGMDQGTQAITGGAASKGILNSGSTAKGLMKFGNDYASSKYGDYLGQLNSLVQQGQGAGQLISGAGQESTASSRSQSNAQSTQSGSSQGGKKGLLDYAAAGAGLVASDPRLKKDVSYVRTLPNGLNVYDYFYINGSGPHRGVMANEVKAFLPEALGPEISGYMTVDMDKIDLNEMEGVD